ncbi:MAG: DUF4259 domain-containing protein [Comamonas sp.]|uniref:DUF4259 domain-containing protein n=1 Tax=Comamonas sp. TaxID=34028 RepID=UPI0030383410
MGTWSHGNFDNDAALDWLIDITTQLLDEISEAMDAPQSLQADALDADLVPCKIELLCTMAESGMAPIWPSAQTLLDWKSVYLKAWDDSIDALQPDAGYQRDRRATLVETFDRMIDLARSDQEQESEFENEE